MPKRTVVFAPGHYYHLYNRGAWRESIFQEPANYLFMLSKVKKYAKEFNIAIIAYCLMTNHYHFLVRQEGNDRAGLLPQRVFNSYVKAFNKRYKRTGTLFEDRFRADHIETEEHLLHLCRYIHANPIKHGFVDRLEDWPYSNYHEWINVRSGNLIDRAFVQKYFSTPDAYRQFVMDYVHERKITGGW